MARRFLGRAIFLRHGQTEYTDVFPDLTNKGVETVTNSANSIECFLKGNSNVVIVTSPAARAQGSASIIAKIIGHRGKIINEPAIRGAIVNNKQQTQPLFN